MASQAISGCSFISDDLVHYDVLSDPPIVVTQAVHRSVRRWRLANLARQFPQLVLAEPDIAVTYDVSGRQPDTYQVIVLDFPETLDALVGARAKGSCKTFESWSPKHRGYLRSAVCGGQWTQARLFSAGLADDNLCQLCLSAIGTLDHRLVCPAIQPHDGWQTPPPQCRRAAR